METREDDEGFQNAVDIMFERLERKKPQHFAVRQYKKYKLAAGSICLTQLLFRRFYLLTNEGIKHIQHKEVTPC